MIEARAGWFALYDGSPEWRRVEAWDDAGYPLVVGPVQAVGKPTEQRLIRATSLRGFRRLRSTIAPPDFSDAADRPDAALLAALSFGAGIFRAGGSIEDVRDHFPSGPERDAGLRGYREAMGRAE